MYELNNFECANQEIKHFFSLKFTCLPDSIENLYSPLNMVAEQKKMKNTGNNDADTIQY